jgi:hypothetical protein
MHPLQRIQRIIHSIYITQATTATAYHKTADTKHHSTSYQHIGTLQQAHAPCPPDAMLIAAMPVPHLTSTYIGRLHYEPGEAAHARRKKQNIKGLVAVGRGEARRPV